MAESRTDPASPLAILLQLEAMARAAESPEALRFLAVNETRRLIPFRNAFYFEGDGSTSAKMRVKSASSLVALDRNSPLVSWIEGMINAQPHRSISHVSYFDRAHCDPEYQSDWDEYSMPYVLWCPLRRPDGSMIGALWLGRETPWQESERTLVLRISGTYAHAMGALRGGNFKSGRGIRNKKLIALVAAVLLLLVLLPVRMSTLAPAEIVARDPSIVSAPMDGVIAQIHAPPNTPVARGDLLFEFEDTNLRNRKVIAERGLQVAQAELRAATQGAFLDAESRAKMSLLKAQVTRHQAELQYAQELLNQVEVRATRDGLLLYGTRSDWIGKLVQTGERVMQVADPRQIEVELLLPVADVITLVQGNEVKLFLDKEPLKAIHAVLTHASYNAEPTDEQVLAYRLTAQLTDRETQIRIGLQGTGKVYGERVSLFFYLFRRPISAFRQLIGW